MSKYEDYEVLSIYDKAIKYLLVVSVLLFSLFHKNISYALGFVLGGIACLVNYKLMIDSLEGMLSKATYSRAFFNGYYLLRLALVMTVLLGALMLESINLFTTIVGILTIRVVVTWEAVTNHIKSNKNLE